MPDNGVTGVLTMIIGVVKQLAVGAMSGLDGLQSMLPDGEFLKRMNAGERRGDTKHCAVASDAKPSSRGFAVCS